MSAHSPLSRPIKIDNKIKFWCVCAIKYWVVCFRCQWPFHLRIQLDLIYSKKYTFFIFRHLKYGIQFCFFVSFFLSFRYKRNENETLFVIRFSFFSFHSFFFPKNSFLCRSCTISFVTISTLG